MRNLTLLESLPESFLGAFDQSINLGYWARKEKTFELSADIPGIKKEDLKIEVDNGVIKLNAENQKRKYIFSTFIPKIIDPNSIEAKLENGVLVLTAVANEKSLGKVIEIK